MRHLASNASLAVCGYVGLYIVSALVVGCNERNVNTQASSSQATPATGQTHDYTVTFYNGGKATGRWQAKRPTSTAGFGRLFFYADGESEPFVLSGTYVLEAKGADVIAAEVAASGARYKVSLYSDAEVVRTFLVQRFNIASDGKLYLLPAVDGEAIVVSGTFVVEPVAVHPRVADAPTRGIVSLYSGGRKVRSWNVIRYRAATAKLYLWVSGGSEPIVVSGDSLIAPKSP